MSGFGIGSVLTPLLMLSMPTSHAVAVLAVPHAWATAIRLLHLRRDVHPQTFRQFGVASAVGGLAGATLQSLLASPVLTVVLASLLVIAGTAEVCRRRIPLPETRAWRLLGGILSGFFGGLVGNQGGIRAAALLGFHLNPRQIVATATASALLVDAARVPIYLFSFGSVIANAVPRLIVISAGVTIGTLLGVPILGRIPESAYRRLVGALLLLLGIGLFASQSACGSRPAPALVLATTTSVANSGLLDRLLPAYPEQVRIMPVGSGLALTLLGRKDADVAITHAPAREAAELRAHPSWKYRKLLYNEFVLVGPPEDPADVGSAGGAASAMRRIASSGATFISRGDDSGTHERERQLWNESGATPAKERLVVAGAGMGQTLRIANSADAYTLTDTGTFAAYQGTLRSQVLVAGDPLLLNTYAVTVDPANGRARRFADWLVDGAGRAILERIVTNDVRGFSIWPKGARDDQPDSSPRR
ncbi:MAG: TSUP family transporter [Acidobacteria bacterium]|nr:TSUP family transporter [Acidobacteriota bacterium]